jgi:glycosyltransferase involved in cell wall biosynthesis
VPKNKANILRIKLAEILEKLVYRRCEHFIVCTPGLKKAYKNLFGDDKKIIVILNGYDLSRDDLGLQENKQSDNEALKCVCIGRFAEYNSGEALRILTELKNHTKDVGKALSLIFVGTEVEPTKQIIEKLALEKQTVFYPRLPYNEALKIAADADMGLCLVRHEAMDFGTKTYDYIGLGLPIFDCFAPDSEFALFFAPFLGKDARELDKKTTEKYRRDNCFKPFLHLFDD